MHGLNLNSLKRVNSLKICVLFNGGWKSSSIIDLGFFRAPYYLHKDIHFQMGINLDNNLLLFKEIKNVCLIRAQNATLGVNK
jgi:hypothetical protein